MMLPYLESVEASTQAAKQAAKSAKKLENVTLTIGAMCTIGPQLVSDLMVRFQAANPGIEVRVIDSAPDVMVDKLEKGELEIGIIGIPEELPPSLHQLPVFQERFVVVLPQNHHLVARNPIRVEELHQEPYVARSNCEVFDVVHADFIRRGVTTRKVFSSPRDDWVQGMIQAGLGFGFFPEYCVTNPEVVVRPLVDPGYARTIYLATVRGRPHSPAVGAFVREARRHQWPSPNPALWAGLQPPPDVESMS